MPAKELPSPSGEGPGVRSYDACSCLDAFEDCLGASLSLSLKLWTCLPNLMACRSRQVVNGELWIRFWGTWRPKSPLGSYKRDKAYHSKRRAIHEVVCLFVLMCSDAVEECLGASHRFEFWVWGLGFVNANSISLVSFIFEYRNTRDLGPNPVCQGYSISLFILQWQLQPELINNKQLTIRN